MIYRVFILLLSLISTLFIEAQTNRSQNSAKQILTFPGLPDSSRAKIKTCNGADVVLFYSGKSMEFVDKNVAAPISFISLERVSSVEGFKHIGLISYKINGSLFMDCDLMMHDTSKELILKFKTKEKNIYYQRMSKEGMEIIQQWLK